MKKITLLYIAVINIIVLQAQVGIGTQNPQADFHVAGDLLIQTELDLSSPTTITNTEEDFKLLTRVKNSIPVGEVRVLNTNTLTVPPITNRNYVLTNLRNDNVVNLTINLATSKYFIGVSNFRYVGDPIKKVPSGTTKSIGNFVIRTYSQYGKWHLEIRNRNINIAPTESVDYHFTLTIYDKKYFRALPNIVTQMGGSSTGVAASIPVLN